MLPHQTQDSEALLDGFQNDNAPVQNTAGLLQEEAMDTFQMNEGKRITRAGKDIKGKEKGIIDIKETTLYKKGL